MKRRRFTGILAGMIICILGVYLFADSGNGFWEGQKPELIQRVQEQAEQMFLPGVAYHEKKTEKLPLTQRIFQMAQSLIPLGTYIAESKEEELAVEDEATYELLTKRQAEDENAVNENGELIGEDKSSETKQAKVEISMDKLCDFDYLVSHFYTVDSVTYISAEDLNAKTLMAKDMRINQEKEGPKVLIFHTHSQEAFADSDGDPSTSIVGVGRYLTELLNDKYGISTLHHEGVYDLIGGKLDRSEAYELAKPKIEQILKENPTVEVVIDLHRDGVGSSTHLVTDIGGKPTAQIMFFNGMCRTRTNGNLTGMTNPYIQDNLAFSMQMKIAAEEKYPGFTRRNYLKGYKYNMDLMPKMLIIEAGAQTNTFQEMKNAMEPLADLLNDVLMGEKDTSE